MASRRARSSSRIRANWRNELAVQYAFKLVDSNFDTFSARGLVDLLGADWRRQLTPKYSLGLNASWYRAPDLGVVESGWGLDVGFSAGKNLLLTTGYNFSGFEDADFTAARYTARGPFVRFSLKVDQASLKDLLRRP